MKLYSGPLSLFARKAEIALNEKNLVFDREMVPFNQQVGYTPKHPEILRINPKAQVPVLIDGALELYDSTVIFEYLEDAYPNPALYPTTPAARAHCRMVELFADEIMLPPLARLMHRTETPTADTTLQSRRDTDAAQAEARLAELYTDLETHLAEAEYFAGTLSVADIAVFMSVTFALRLGGPGLAHHPRLAAWYRRVAARPAFARAAAEMAEADRLLSQPITRNWP